MQVRSHCCSGRKWTIGPCAFNVDVFDQNICCWKKCQDHPWKLWAGREHPSSLSKIPFAFRICFNQSPDFSLQQWSSSDSEHGIRWKGEQVLARIERAPWCARHILVSLGDHRAARSVQAHLWESARCSATWVKLSNWEKFLCYPDTQTNLAVLDRHYVVHEPFHPESS